MAALVIAAAAGSVVSCTDQEKAPKPVSAPVESVNVKVNSPGDGPREPLVLFSDAEQQNVNFSATKGLEQRTEGGAPSEGKPASDNDLPYQAVTMNLPLQASSTTDGKSRISDIVVGKPSGNNEDMNKSIATAEGFKMSTEQALDGRVTKREYSAPESADNGARASVEEALGQMNDFPLVFPQDPVGPGASWTVSNRIDDTVSLLQDITYKLVQHKGKTVKLDVTVKRRPATKTMAGTDLEVQDVQSTSQGSLAVDLTKTLPAQGFIETSTAITYGKSESPTHVVQTTKSKAEWKPERA